MALREILIRFEHFAPGDVTADITFTDTVNAQSGIEFHGRNEEDILRQIPDALPAALELLEKFHAGT